MPNFNQLTTLDLAESYAEENPREGLLSSEEELSERFDEDVLPHVIAEYGEDDGPAISEAFNNWTDSLCTDGLLHSEQYDSYCYVGRLADD